MSKVLTAWNDKKKWLWTLKKMLLKKNCLQQMLSMEDPFLSKNKNFHRAWSQKWDHEIVAAKVIIPGDESSIFSALSSKTK